MAMEGVPPLVSCDRRVTEEYFADKGGAAVFAAKELQSESTRAQGVDKLRGGK